MMSTMKRTTVMLPDDVEVRVRLEARRRGVSVAQVVREAVERAVSAPETVQPLGFFAVGEGGPADASERVDDYVRRGLRRR
jgi:plasmid stability protein